MNEGMLLREESSYPDEALLESVLKQTYPTYKDLLKKFETLEIVPEWRYYNDGKAWLCKVQRKKRTILWISIWDGFFKATAYYPLRLINEVYALDIKEEQKEIFRAAKSIGKTHPCTFEIRQGDSLDDLEKVMVLKISSK